MSQQSWKEVLKDRISAEMGQEIDTFENQIDLKRKGKIEDKVFAEIRLRRGAYGQRYDNGKRHDGEKTQAINFPNAQLTKGPDTLFEAPGMQRIKIPFGGLNTEQLEMLADIAEEYSDSIVHITTRQDIQLHYILLDDCSDMHRRLASVGITVREACGNSVRNVTACPLAGICNDEAFDVTPYADAMAQFLQGHRDTQDFGRKIKPAFSGCQNHACGLAMMHDIGCIAKTRIVDGKEQRGFDVYVGGGLGAIPYQAKLLEAFVSEEELLPLSQAISRVFARLGEKRNRGRARVKFLVAKLGIEEFQKLVREERKKLTNDPAWSDWIPQISSYDEDALSAPAEADATVQAGFDNWRKANVYPQRQAGFFAVTIMLPLGDMTSKQARDLAVVSRRYVKDTLRTTVEQNLVMRWVHEADLPALHRDLSTIGLGEAGAESMIDIVSCPGTDTCKLGIASSRGLGAELRGRLSAKGAQFDPVTKNIRIKISGCFNSCAQHHVAEIGFYGVSRTAGNYKVPHFQLILGGRWGGNADTYGKSIGVVPSKRVPDVVDMLIDTFREQRDTDETFDVWAKRVGKREIKTLLKPFAEVPEYFMDPDFYADWGDPREFTIGDIGVGECAGELVSLSDFGVAAAESELFDAQVCLEEGDDSVEIYKQAADKSISAMVMAAQGLIKTQDPDISDDPAVIVDVFRKQFCDTKLFDDPFAGAKFANYFFHAFESRDEVVDRDRASRRIDEAQLFIEATHACHSRMLENK